MEKESHNESGAAQKLPRVVIPTRLQWNVVRAKVTTIKEAKDLATLPLDELIKNLKDYDIVLDNDGVGSTTTKETMKSLALKAKVTREQTSDDSDSQDGSDEDIDEEEEAEAFNLLAKNFCNMCFDLIGVIIVSFELIVALKVSKCAVVMWP
nr:hypothetical protein [Tanacetum cinerariifolium]